MAQPSGKRQTSVWRSVDWWTILLYIALLSFGWISVCGASYSYGETDIFSLATRSGMQIVWIGTSIMLGFIILMLDDRFYDTFAYIIFVLMLLLLFATIFNPHTIKGSRSWLVMGPLRLQPAEFAKFSTALALAKLMSTYGYNINQWKHFAATLALILLPMLCIVLQRETGSALVYLAFFLMFYREGMPGSILFTGVAMVVYFVVGIRFADVTIGDSTTSVGKFSVMLLVQLFTIGMVWVYCERRTAWRMLLCCVGVTLASLLLLKIPFDIVYIQLAMVAVMIGYIVWEGLGTRLRSYFFIALFAFALSLACLSSPNGDVATPVSFFVSDLIAIAVFGLFQAVFMANAGGCWDNAKKIVEVDLAEKGTPLHEATVVGDTVGDPFKDTAGPSVNILIKLLSMVSIVFASLVVMFGGMGLF